MDFGSILGLLVGIIIVVYGIVAGQNFDVLLNFWDFNSVLITFGGSFTSVLTMYTLKDYISNLKGFSRIFKPPLVDEAGTIHTIIELSNVARKEGLLALEEAANNLDDEFLKKGVLLIVDGTDPELVRAILETELMCVEDRHRNVIGFWDNIATAGPAWGMIGTLIGLINMLKMMDDASSIGPQMSIALITTLYGSLLANWVATPAANKMRAFNDVELRMKEVMIEGLLSIQAGENPRVIEEKLKSFLSPKKREEMQAQKNGGEPEDG